MTDLSARTDARAMLEALGLAVYAVDLDGCCCFINAAALQRLGYGDAAALMGRNMHAAIHHTREDGSAFAQEDCPLLATARTGTPVHMQHATLWRADGTGFTAEYSSYPLRRADGSLDGCVVSFSDSTALREEQGRTRRSEARFRTIANAIPQLAWMTDAEGSIVWYNQRWYDYTGTDFSQMQGWGWQSVHHPDHIDRVVRRLEHSFASGQDWEDTFPLRGSDGAYHWFLSRALPIREEADASHPDGRVIGWFGTNTDITEMRDAVAALEAARDEAQAANEAKSTFLANMSHELRTPLSAIIGYSEMLAEELEDGPPGAGVAPPELRRDVGKIEANARHLLGLINDVLDLSKVESGKMDAFAEDFDVTAMVGEVAQTVGALLDRNRNRLVLELADGLGAMHSDVTRLRQMLLNLLGNATKFTEDGTITLRVAREGGWLSFAVQDTGIGMTEEQLSGLFRRFAQADASTTRQFGGTGLGLALTRAFATLLGGRVEVASTHGQGSVFTLHLPARLVSPAADADGVRQEDLPDRGDEGRPVVLVVDDDAAQRELTSRFLEREGFAARVAPDGAAALALARSLKPHAILLDVQMPGMDGWQVLSALKADPELEGIPVVMVTFLAERALASSLGAAEYVSKPVDWGRLHDVMQRFATDEGDVLLVDDDPDIRGRLRHVLEREGWSVAEAENGEQALAAVTAARPRVILLDLSMPVMDGFEFLAALRRRPDGDVPVVVLTAMDLGARDRARLRGTKQVLNKAELSPREVAARLRSLEGVRTPGDGAGHDAAGAA